jgi:methionine-S-sulfoxide reductase
VTSASATASDQEQKTTESAYFAGGCFWCMEADFEKRNGVVEVISGYMGGETEDPSYEQVASGDTQHYEAVKVRYKAEKLDYKDLLATFWANIDPYDDKGQFCDKGPQYRAAIFARNDQELEAAKASKRALQDAGITDKDIVTKIHKAGPFYRAKEYHQDYYKKNTIRYKFYRYNCGRDERLQEVWGKANLSRIIQ